MLLVGPPGSGKTYRVLGELQAASKRGRPVTLVVPTASMAEHLQHELARRGLAVSPNSIVPFTGFIEGLTPDCRELSRAVMPLLLARALEESSAAEFAEVAHYPGFHAKLLETIEEFWAAGAAPGDGPFRTVMAGLERLLAKARVVHRAQRLRMAAQEVSKRKLGMVLFDGFFHFTPVELDFLAAVVKSAESIIVTLPDAGAEQARKSLLGMGLAEVRLDRIYRCPQVRMVVQAPSPEREIEDIAGRILLDQKTTGRPFQEYGMIVRSPELYFPILETVFERFGIPFRSRQPQMLAAHSAIRFLTGLLRLAAGGFDGGQALDVLKLGGSGIALTRQMERYEFCLRNAMPVQGADVLLRLAEKFPLVKARIAKFGKLAAWARENVPPQEWARRCAELSSRWFRLPRLLDGVTRETVLAWRSLAEALQAWNAAAEEAAAALVLEGAERIALSEYLAVLETVLRLALLQPVDRRRNVVQVLTVYEARQWELPVVFVCGLVEKWFPRHHPQNLFFPDKERIQLGAAGCRLRTSADRDQEERFLFDFAATRATEQLYLTYPTHDDAGAETLRSFFLEPEEPAATARRVLLREQPPELRPAPPYIRNPELLEALFGRIERFSPSSLDRYLQCPFQFFAERTLRLSAPPASPDDRINEALKGEIIHCTIARWAAGNGEDIERVFETVFAAACGKAGIRPNFSAEVMRIQLLADLKRFASHAASKKPLDGFHFGPPESEFEYVVEPGAEKPFRVAGRIDRHETSDAGAAVVVDYKYSSKERIARMIEEHEQGVRLQGPLYLLGLEKQKGLVPAGVVLYGLRNGISRRGWCVPEVASGDPDLTPIGAKELRRMLERAAESTLQIVREIRSGRIEVKPREVQFCRDYCAYREVCRVEL
jgi:ATP-dependent helicase/DNAse subunit B